MVKIVGTIVNDALFLIGLKIQTDDGNVANFTLAQIKQTGLDNSQMTINNNVMRLKGNFRLNSIPMEIFLGGDTFAPINNEITVTGRENNGTADTAYTVVTGDGRNARVDLKNLAAITQLFKPVNFTVNRRADNGTIYLTSKPGYPKISELPIVAGVAKTVHQRTMQKNVVKPSGALSFWNLTAALKSMNGVFIRLPHVTYNAETHMIIPADATGVNDISNFGEFAEPEFEVVTTNANLNLSFRAKVQVDICENGVKKFDIWSNKISTKIVYKNGKNNLSEIGILVKKTVQSQLEEILAGYKHGALEETKLKTYYAKAVGYNDASSLCIIWLSLKDIPAFTQADIAALSAQMHAPAAFSLDIYDYTCMKKALVQFTKVKREAIKAGVGIKTVSPELAQYTPEQLKLIAASGIDTTYNSYMFKAEKTADSEDAATTKSEYAIKWEIPFLKTVNVEAGEKLKNEVTALTDALANLYKNNKIDEANGVVAQSKKRANELAYIIQITNISMLYAGNFEYVKLPNKPGLSAQVAKTNTQLLIDTNGMSIDGTPLEQARAVVSGWEVK